MRIRAYDSGGETIDRYTVVYLDHCTRGRCAFFGASDNPTHPQGFGQHGELSEGDTGGEHLGQRVGFCSLPLVLRRFVLRDLGLVV